ncbi:MAG: hypothetical protein H7332_08665 [Bdellovibrionales bacterium]|nr:hypothetical protein [Ramlibacter sp.]
MKNFTARCAKHTAGMFAACVAAVLMTACGGGDDAPAATAPVVTAAPEIPLVPVVPVVPVVTGSASGTLIDAAVGGVSYITSSGVTGTTAVDGSYDFNPGDTVTFTLGGLTLGTATATGIISPMELSGGSAVRLQNLLVLLQSLDSDGNPGNGVIIPAGAAAAVTSSVNLAGGTATFAADAGLQGTMTAGGVSGAPKSNDVASAHFLAQALPLVAGNIWVSQSVDVTGQTRTSVLNIESTGRYVQVEAGPSEVMDTNTIGATGIEAGTLTAAGFTPQGYNFTATIATDSNLGWGVSGLLDCGRFRNTGDQLVTGNCTNSRGVFSKLPNTTMGIVGGWRTTYLDPEFGTEESIDHYFLANGTFLKAYYRPGCAKSCISSAYYGTYTAASGEITLTGAGEIYGSPGTYTFSTDGREMTLEVRRSKVRTFTRLAR